VAFAPIVAKNHKWSNTRKGVAWPRSQWFICWSSRWASVCDRVRRRDVRSRPSSSGHPAKTSQGRLPGKPTHRANQGSPGATLNFASCFETDRFHRRHCWGLTSPCLLYAKLDNTAISVFGFSAGRL